MALIDHNRLKSKKVRQFLQAFNLNSEADLGKLKSTSVKEGESGFYSHFGEFFIDAPLDVVWQHYTTCSPVKAWNNEHMNLLMLFDRKTENLFYPDAESFPKMEQDILIFINVHFIYGKVKVMVGHEVDFIDENERLIKTNYLENSKSTGSQYIRFYEAGPNRTRIAHDSYYSSNSWFRDRVLYPALHTITIAAFHNNLKKQLLG